MLYNYYRVIKTNKKINMILVEVALGSLPSLKWLKDLFLPPVCVK